MAPIHHHFELEAWSETKIMLRFWIVAAACGAIGFTVYQTSIKPTSSTLRTQEHGEQAFVAPRRTTSRCPGTQTKAHAGVVAHAGCRHPSSTGY
jgi:hypothetical protein